MKKHKMKLWKDNRYTKFCESLICAVGQTPTQYACISEWQQDAYSTVQAFQQIFSAS